MGAKGNDLSRRDFMIRGAAAAGIVPYALAHPNAMTSDAFQSSNTKGIGSMQRNAISKIGNTRTEQFTTFDLDRGSKTVHIPRGERVTIGQVSGEGRIRCLWLTFPGWFWQHWNTAAPVSQTILKTLILRIYWDEASVPAIEVPMGDFFGVGLCETANFVSRYFGMPSGGFLCRFPMPFRNGFRIEVENLDTESDTDLFLNALYQLEPVADDEGYLHAQFHTARCLGHEPARVAEFEGKGSYVGVTLSMQGEERTYLSFLEAPEYVYIDDDWDRPRITGTGLEDYFLGGWYFRDGPVIGDLHGVPVKDTFSASVAMYRIHETDAIHFDRRFRMEFVNPWRPEQLKPYRYSSAAFAYLERPDGMGLSLPDRDDLLCWLRIRDNDHMSVP